jgi:hypothetical protein
VLGVVDFDPLPGPDPVPDQLDGDLATVELYTLGRKQLVFTRYVNRVSGMLSNFE